MKYFFITFIFLTTAFLQGQTFTVEPKSFENNPTLFLSPKKAESITLVIKNSNGNKVNEIKTLFAINSSTISSASSRSFTIPFDSIDPGKYWIILIFGDKSDSVQVEKIKGEQNDYKVDRNKFGPGLFLCTTTSLSSTCDYLPNFLCDKGCYTIPNTFNFVLAKNCYYSRDRQGNISPSKHGNAITPKYITVFDRRTEMVTFLKLKNEKGFEYLKTKKQIRPFANSEMYVLVIAKDTGYTVKCENEDYFMEYEESFAKSIENAGAKKDTSAKSSKPGPSATKDSTKVAKAELYNNESNTVVQKMQPLDDAIGILLARYPERSIIDDRYYADLSCLRISITNEMGAYHYADTPNVVNLRIEAEALYDTLVKIIKGKDPKQLALAFLIKVHYQTFLMRQVDSYKISATQIQIPDRDLLKFSIQKNSTSAKPLIQRDFKVSGGFKIDFSAGVFLTGLASPEFVVQDHSFQYKQTTTKVDSTSGAIVTKYTGKINDTTGKLIHEKNPLLNYAAGFLCHAYVRTGSFANAGLTTGLVVNNNGFQMLLGGSLLLNIRKSRVSLSAGMAIGNQKTLSPTMDQSRWTDAYPDGKIFETRQALPVFSQVTDVPTYYQWKRSWFFGLTYNFASTTVKW